MTMLYFLLISHAKRQEVTMISLGVVDWWLTAIQKIQAKLRRVTRFYTGTHGSELTGLVTEHSLFHRGESSSVLVPTANFLNRSFAIPPSVMLVSLDVSAAYYLRSHRLISPYIINGHKNQGHYATNLPSNRLVEEYCIYMANNLKGNLLVKDI